MPQPVSYNPGTPVSGSIQENNISYVVDGQQRNYRGGFGGLSWMSEVPAENNVIFIGNSTSLGRGPAGIPLFYPAYNNSAANIVYAANTLPGSPRNFTTTGSAYNWAVANNFFINNSDNPIPRIDADGLALYLDANQPTSYPQTGTGWYDISGRNTNGTLTNGPTWNSNGWFQFDGVDDYVNFGTVSGGVGGSSEATMELLINMTFPQALQQIFGFRDNSGFDFFFLAFSGGGTEFRARNSAGTIYDLNPSISSYAGKWTQINFSVGPSGRKVYANGNLIDSNPTWTGTFGSTSPLSLGNYQIGNIWFATGNANNVKLYNKELSQAEIKQNYFQSNIVQDGLVFMVDANNLVSYPKSGTAWYNLTGSVASATLTNGPTFNNINGGIINFDGVDDYAVTSNFPSLSNWSTEMWLNPNVYTTAQKVILDVNLGIRFEISNGFFNSHFGNGSGWIYTNLPSTTQIAPNTWFHVIVTVDASVNYQAKVYVNGVLENTTGTSSGTTPNVPLYIARFTGAGGYEFNGKIANTRIYSKALTASEVQQNYQATKEKFLGQNIVTNGLVLNLDAANKDSYPGTGTTWYDLSGNANNGTLLNGVAFNANKNGGVMYFDDTDDTVSIGNSSLFSITNAMTVFAWVNPSSTSGWDGIFGGSISGFVHFQLYFGAINVYIYGPNASYYNNDSYIVPANAWISIGFTYDGTTLKVYVNGSQLATTVPGSGNVSSNSDVRVGWAYDTSRVFGGYIGTTQVYNRALSATEITQNYNATKVRFGL